MVYDPDVGVDRYGNAFTAWKQHSPTYIYPDPVVGFNRFATGIGWGTTNVLYPFPTGIAAFLSSPRIAVDDNGNVVMVFVAYGYLTDSLGNHNNEHVKIYAGRYIPGMGWETFTRIGTDLTTTKQDLYTPSIAMDRNGNAAVVWNSSGAPPQVWANLYVAGSGWMTATQMGNTTSDDFITYSSPPRIAIGGNGKVIIVWTNSQKLYCKMKY